MTWIQHSASSGAQASVARSTWGVRARVRVRVSGDVDLGLRERDIEKGGVSV